MVRIIAFDFDGVVLESVSVKDQAVFDLFEGISAEQRRQVLDIHRSNPGIDRRRRINLLLTEGLGWQAAPEEIDRLLDRFSGLACQGLLDCPEVPGIRDFLETVKAIPLYIVSAAPGAEVRAVARARGFSRYFKDILGTPPLKAEILAEIVRRENVPAESILFIGDKISDYRAAENAGVLFAGRRTRENPADFPADVPVVDDFEEGALRIRQIFFQNSIKDSKKIAD